MDGHYNFLENLECRFVFILNHNFAAPNIQNILTVSKLPAFQRILTDKFLTPGTLKNTYLFSLIDSNFYFHSINNGEKYY